MVVRSVFVPSLGVIHFPKGKRKRSVVKSSVAEPVTVSESIAPTPVHRSAAPRYVNGLVQPIFSAPDVPMARVGFNSSAAIVSAVSSLLQWESEGTIDSSVARANKACRSATAAGLSDCGAENRQILILFMALSLSIVFVLCLCCHIREDKEEQITPLCPQLMVKGGSLKFKLRLEASEDGVDVTDSQGSTIGKVITARPDPIRPSYSGVAATVSLHNDKTGTLATVVVRNVCAIGQGLCLCRAGNEIFGFMEPDPNGRTCIVRHRSGVNIMTIACDFSSSDDIVMSSPVGVKLCAIRKMSDGDYVGEVAEHCDAGLMICCLFGVYLSIDLKTKPQLSSWDFATPHETSA